MFGKTAQVFAMHLRRAKVSDAEILSTLHMLTSDRIEQMHEATQERVAILRKLREWAEDGKIAIVESGTDCDCVQYTGHVHVVSAERTEFWKAVDRMYDSSEGSISWYLCRVSETHNVKQTSRDRVLEAYENGRGTRVVI